MPMTTAQLKNNKPEPTWVKVRSSGEWAYVLCEQIRYVDKRRCATEKDSQLRLLKFDWEQVRKKLTLLLFPMPPPVEDLEDQTSLG